MNEKQYDNCIQITSTNIICKQEQPTAMANNLDNCELKLFTNSREVPKNCDKRIISSDQCIFVQLNNGKEWLFVAPKTETVTINCKLQPNPIQIDITGTGKLSLDNTCIGYTNHFILTPQGPLLSNELNTDFVTRININDTYFDNINLINRLNLTVNENYKKLSTDNLDSASHKLDDIIKLADNSKRNNEPKMFSKNNLYNFSMILILVL